MEVRQARYFLAVAEELHFGRAAQRLHMSQPPLSQAILALERELGVRLLHRTSRQVTLTRAGEVLLGHCRELVRESERVREAVRQAHDGLRGELVIGAVASAFTDLLPPVLRRYRRLRPEVRLRMVEVDTDAGAVAVRNREVDLALIRRRTAEPGMRVVPLHEDVFVAVLPLDHPLAGGTGELALSELAGDPWVWIPRANAADYHDEVVTACRRAGFRPDTRHQANSTATQVAMVAGGIGVAVVPELTTRARSDVAVRRLRAAPMMTLSILWRNDADPLVEHFVTMVASTSDDPVVTGE